MDTEHNRSELLTPYDRLISILEAKTQADAAKILEVRQSVLSDCKRRGKVLDSVLKNARRLGINPLWITEGKLPKHLPDFSEGLLRVPGCSRYCLNECPVKEAVEQALRLIRGCPYICRACEHHPRRPSK